MNLIFIVKETEDKNGKWKKISINRIKKPHVSVFDNSKMQGLQLYMSRFEKVVEHDDCRQREWAS